MVLGSCATHRTADGRLLWSAKADPRLLGDRILVVFMPDDWPARLSGDEQDTYSAWANMLEEFVSRAENLTEVRKVDFRQADELFTGRGLPVNEYTLLVVRGDGYGLYSSEPVLEGAAFDYAQAFLGSMEKDFYWPGILHAGESPAHMPREWRLVRLRPGHFARPFQVPAPPPPQPASPAEPSKTAPVMTQPAGHQGPPVVPGAKAPPPLDNESPPAPSPPPPAPAPAGKDAPSN